MCHDMHETLGCSVEVYADCRPFTVCGQCKEQQSLLRCTLSSRGEVRSEEPTVITMGDYSWPWLQLKVVLLSC